MRLMARIQACPVMLATACIATLLAWRQSAWGSASMLSARMRCSESMHTFSTKCVATIQESAFDAAIMNMVIICCRASRSTSEPFSIAHIMFPGMVMTPITLRRGTDDKRWCGWEILFPYLIWLIVGIKPRRSASTKSGRYASGRGAPGSVSVLLRLSLSQVVESICYHGHGSAYGGGGENSGDITHSSFLRMWPSDTEIPVIVFPHSIPTMGTTARYEECAHSCGSRSGSRVSQIISLRRTNQKRLFLTILFRCPKRGNLHRKACSQDRYWDSRRQYSCEHCRKLG
jgi:hypothetical protein